MRFFVVGATLLLPFLVALTSASLDVWPQPSMATTGSTIRYLSRTFDIDVPANLQRDEDLVAVVKDTLDSLQSHSTFDDSFKVQDVHDVPIERLQVRLVVNTTKRQQNPFWSVTHATTLSLRSLVVAPLEHLQEWYTLDVSDTRTTVVLRAYNALGVLRGLTTFKQLVRRSRKGQHATLHVAGLPLRIEDQPAFPYRGVMLDTARNYLSPDTMKRQMDVMAMVKLNQLHWHATDTSSWPLALRTRGMEVLAQDGAYSQSQVYDAATIAELIEYGVRRGVNVILEIDMPGHQYMGVRSYPGDLIVCGDQSDWTSWGNEPPTGHLDLRKPAATQLMKDVISEVLISMPGHYISTGNDEVNAHCYGLEKGDVNGTDRLLAPFVENVHGHIISQARTPMVWEEAALNFPLTAQKLREGTLVEAWTGSNNVGRILSNTKLRLIHAPVDYFYLDCGMGSFLSDDVNGASWCAYVSWQKQYSFDPYNGTQAVHGGRDRVMGGESALWSEQVDEANVEQMLWPRAAAGAEVFWTGDQYGLDGIQHIRNIQQAAPRMQSVRQRMREMGIGASPLQPQWCATRPGRCSLPKGQ